MSKIKVRHRYLNILWVSYVFGRHPLMKLIDFSISYNSTSSIWDVFRRRKLINRWPKGLLFHCYLYTLWVSYVFRRHPLIRMIDFSLRVIAFPAFGTFSDVISWSTGEQKDCFFIVICAFCEFHTFSDVIHWWEWLISHSV